MNPVSNWLAEKSADDSYYLKSLNQIEDVDLSIYQSMECEFSEKAIRELILDLNWRSQLIAYTYTMA